MTMTTTTTRQRVSTPLLVIGLVVSLMLISGGISAGWQLLDGPTLLPQRPSGLTIIYVVAALATLLILFGAVQRSRPERATALRFGLLLATTLTLVTAVLAGLGMPLSAGIPFTPLSLWNGWLSATLAGSYAFYMGWNPKLISISWRQFGQRLLLQLTSLGLVLAVFGLTIGFIASASAFHAVMLW
jgi:hypothetical protein